MNTSETSSHRGCLARARGVILVVSALAVGILSWIVLTLLDDALSKDPDNAEAAGSFLKWSLENRPLVAALALVPAIIGVVLTLRGAGRRGDAVGWSLFILGLLSELALFIIVIAAFIAFLTPLYEYRPL